MLYLRYIMKTVDWIAIIITGTIALVIIIIVLGSVITGNKMSPDGIKILGDLLIALVAIISMYVGSKIRNKD